MKLKPTRRQPVQWQRIYRQTTTLMRKNFLIFYTSPISTAFRALIFPLVAALVLCFLKYLESSVSASDDSGLALTAKPIRELADAMHSVGRSKLVFVLNGTSPEVVSPIVDTIRLQPGMDQMELLTVDESKNLFDTCKQSVVGRSDCYAAVVFASFNETNVHYSIAIDDSYSQGYWWGNWKDGDNMLTNFIFPLQWAVESTLGGFSDSPRPSTHGIKGTFGPNAYNFADESGATVKGGSVFWVSLVAIFVGPIFILILIGVVYHLAIFVATERETSMAELMGSQQVTIVPRIISTMLSFFAIYFPGLLFSSIIMTQVLFIKTSDILMIFLTLLAGASFIASTHFLASFFGKANLAGLYTSTLSFALALITLAATLTERDPRVQILALSAIFPPCTWATLIEDIAMRESNYRGFGLATVPRNPQEPKRKVQQMDGYLYIVFFLMQIVVYSLAAYCVEKYVWGITRDFETIEASSDVAVRCTGLSKTYHGKRRWYWPFSKAGKSVVAVDNLNLEVKKGSVTFLLGPNGGGKTTTLKCVAGMVQMDAGSRLELNEDGVVFGQCPQHNVFWTGLTVRQHIKIWRELKTAAAETTVDDDDVIAECDLLEKIDAPANTLSGGQMRKLQLAISFAGGSKVVCIDEASSGLDPLSRRNIWDVIQNGHSRRTILITTHFLDEADVLADHVVIVYKGKLVCEGPGTTLKARYGDNYLIRSNQDDEHNDEMVWRTTNSAEATRKLLELEALDNDHTYNVVFPTLEQVFLKVTADTAIHAQGGDGFVGEVETGDVVDEKIFAMEQENQVDIDLDVGRGIGFARQVQALFVKRYVLLTSKSGWISYGINLIIPIIAAAAVAGFLSQFKPLKTCDMNVQALRAPMEREFNDWLPGFPAFRYPYTPSFYTYDDRPLAILGPSSEWDTEVQAELYLDNILPYAWDTRYQPVYVDGEYIQPEVDPNERSLAEVTLGLRTFVPDLSAVEFTITNFSGTGFYGFGIFSPTPETAIIYHQAENQVWSAVSVMPAFNLVTNRIANATSSSGARIVSTALLSLRSPTVDVDFRLLPMGILIVLAFVASVSVAGIYPAYEKVNNVRALQYCNGVSPAALWLAYLLFDIQFIVAESIIVWAAMFANPMAKVLYYEESYLLGIFILFGIAAYLGTYVLSLFIRKAAFAVAAGVHILLFIIYLVSYIIVESAGDIDTRYATYTLLQYTVGLLVPAANLGRGIWVASNTFGVLCGQFADADVSNPMSYDRYGSPYANLIIQIIFLAAVLGIYEYGSKDFIRRNITHRGTPTRLHYRVEDGGQPSAPVVETEKNVGASAVQNPNEILQVKSISKYFGKTFAVENVSFNISPNETLALLGGNGAGKTTVINMIRGELTPNFGDIFLDGTSVLRNVQKARIQMGVCPQDDAVDNLTVRQTLRFYATVKGLSNVEGNVDKVLSALNITSYEDLRVAALSGGTKRKLSVAIALLGNPRVLLLDEPSTGQDAGAKRILWRALKDISANRAILLTTHSMEEAEALATNVAIMGTKMLATGTLTSLQASHGGKYMIRAVRELESDAKEVEAVVKREFENMVSNYEDAHGQVSFGLPHDKGALGSIMKVMEKLKGDLIRDKEEEDDSAGDLGVAGSRSGGAGAAGGSSAAVQNSTRVFSDYTINGPTLEEIFMNVARESGIVGGV